MGLRASALASVGYLPPVLWRPAARLGGEIVARRPPRPIRQWQLNAAVMTGSRPDRAMTAAAVRSWSRTLVTSMQLAHWSARRIDESVRIDPEALAVLLREHRSRGVVLALPHMGSWDLAGAWAARRGLAPSVVAEALPDGQFEVFVRARERMGMTVHGHRDEGLVPALLGDLDRGHSVCLVSDRDFSRHGVPMTWPTARGRVSATMPAGPAHIAAATGAALIAVASHYDGPRTMVLELSDPIDLGVGPRARQVSRGTQALADWFAARIRDHVVDWHMLQPFFPEVRA